MNLRIFAVFASFILAGICSGQEIFSDKLENLKNDPGMAGAGIGVVVRETAADIPIYQVNPSQLFIPGSLMKLVTSAAALEILGPDYIFRTTLAYGGQIDSISGQLNGDLYIVGGGDPCLGSERFAGYYSNPDFITRWVEAVRMAGIRQINGNICFDNSAYGINSTPGTWVWEDLGNYFGASANGLSAFDNMFRVVLRSEPEAGKPAVVVGTIPEIDDPKIESYVVSAETNKDETCIYGSPWGGSWKIFGSMPLGRWHFEVKASLPEPGYVVAGKLKKQLTAEGIKITGSIKNLKAGAEVKKIGTVDSPPLSEIVEKMNHESINLYAEHLINQLALLQTGQGSTSQGIQIVRQFWEEKGIAGQSLFMEDGSGLSHYNAVSPETLADILDYMKTSSPYFSEFYASLPSEGEGTFSVFDPSLFPGGSLHGKSGSMRRVRCYAGYLVAGSGKELTFVLMFNNFSMAQNQLVKKIEELLATLWKEY